MDKNNIILLSHIGVEVLVVGGMFAYFQVKMNKQQEKIENLEKYISQLSSAIEMHEEAIKQIYSQINPQGPPPRGPPQRKKPKVQPPKTGGLKFNNEDVKNRKLAPKTAPVEEVPEDVPEEEEEEVEDFFDETELDEELEELESQPEEEEAPKKKGRKQST